MALEMIQNATATGISYTWVTGDCVYGDYRTIRMWLEGQRKVMFFVFQVKNICKRNIKRCR